MFLCTCFMIKILFLYTGNFQDETSCPILKIDLHIQDTSFRTGQLATSKSCSTEKIGLEIPCPILLYILMPILRTSMRASLITNFYQAFSGYISDPFCQGVEKLLFGISFEKAKKTNCVYLLYYAQNNSPMHVLNGCHGEK